MKKIRLTALLLALTGVLLAGCHGAAAPEKPAEAADVAGADWRTWGWIDDTGVLIAPDGEEISLLLCVFTENAVLFYDDDTQTAFADLRYPYGATCSQLKRLGTCPMIGGEKKDR